MLAVLSSVLRATMSSVTLTLQFQSQRSWLFVDLGFLKCCIYLACAFSPFFRWQRKQLANFFFISFVTVSLCSFLHWDWKVTCVSKPTGNIFKPRTCSAQSWVVLPLASNEMSWVLTHAQFIQSIHLNQGFCLQMLFCLTKEKWQKPEPPSPLWRQHCPLPGQAGASVSLSLC